MSAEPWEDGVVVGVGVEGSQHSTRKSKLQDMGWGVKGGGVGWGWNKL